MTNREWLKRRSMKMSDNKLENIKKQLLKVLEEYCKDHDYSLQVFAGMARWIDVIEDEAHTQGYAEGVFNASLKPFIEKKIEEKLKQEHKSNAI